MEIEQKPRALDTPVQPDTVEKEALKFNATLLNTGNPDRPSSRGEVVPMPREMKLPSHSLGISPIVKPEVDGSLDISSIPHHPTSDRKKVNWSNNEGGISSNQIPHPHFKIKLQGRRPQ